MSADKIRNRILINRYMFSNFNNIVHCNFLMDYPPSPDPDC